MIDMSRYYKCIYEQYIKVESYIWFFPQKEKVPFPNLATLIWSWAVLERRDGKREGDSGKSRRKINSYKVLLKVSPQIHHPQKGLLIISSPYFFSF